MPPVRRFEELIAWQKARILTREIYRLTQSGALARDYDLSRQLRRAGISVMANIAEGFERARRAELRHFLSVAKASNGELLSHLYVAFDAGYLVERDFNRLKASCEEVGRIIGGLRASLAAKK